MIEQFIHFMGQCSEGGGEIGTLSVPEGKTAAEFAAEWFGDWFYGVADLVTVDDKQCRTRRIYPTESAEEEVFSLGHMYSMRLLLEAMDEHTTRGPVNDPKPRPLLPGMEGFTPPPSDPSGPTFTGPSAPAVPTGRLPQ